MVKGGEKMGLELKNDINPTTGKDGIKCPLVDGMIEESNCLENAMITAGFMDESTMISKFKEKENWKEICQNCPNFSF